MFYRSFGFSILVLGLSSALLAGDVAVELSAIHAKLMETRRRALVRAEPLFRVWLHQPGTVKYLLEFQSQADAWQQTLSADERRSWDAELQHLEDAIQGAIGQAIYNTALVQGVTQSDLPVAFLPINEAALKYVVQGMRPKGSTIKRKTSISGLYAGLIPAGELPATAAAGETGTSPVITRRRSSSDERVETRVLTNKGFVISNEVKSEHKLLHVCAHGGTPIMSDLDMLLVFHPAATASAAPAVMVHPNYGYITPGELAFKDLVGQLVFGLLEGIHPHIAAGNKGPDDVNPVQHGAASNYFVPQTFRWPITIYLPAHVADALGLPGSIIEIGPFGAPASADERLESLKTLADLIRVMQIHGYTAWLNGVQNVGDGESEDWDTLRALLQKLGVFVPNAPQAAAGAAAAGAAAAGAAAAPKDLEEDICESKMTDGDRAIFEAVRNQGILLLDAAALRLPISQALALALYQLRIKIRYDQ